MQYGFTFAKRQCDWLGLDWKKVAADLNHERLQIVRLGTYWDEIESSPGEYDFSQIRKEIELFSGQDKQLIVTLGMKAPRWPEFYIPDHIKNKVGEKITQDVDGYREIADRCLELIGNAFKELSQYQNIIYWQIENEPLDPQWPDDTYISSSFLQKEIDLIRSLDDRKILINTWGNDLGERETHKKIFNLSNIDGIGFDFYNKQFDSDLKEKYRGPDLSVDEISRIVEETRENGFMPFVAELQAEPWEEEFDYRKEKGRIKSTSLQDIKNNIQTYSQMDFEFILLWGAEYWVWEGVVDQIFEYL